MQVEIKAGLWARIFGVLAKVSLALILAMAVAYGVDDMWALYRGKPGAVVKVDRYYTDRNRWNEIEYSVGTSVDLNCIYSLFPHFGEEPCWYTTEHTLRKVDATS